MEPLPHEGAGAIGARLSQQLPPATADAALAAIAYAANQVLAGQVTLAHLWGELAHAHARELATSGARAMPEGAWRDAIASLAAIEARFADGVIAAANRYGRRFAHLAFAFPVSPRLAR